MAGKDKTDGVCDELWDNEDKLTMLATLKYAAFDALTSRHQYRMTDYVKPPPSPEGDKKALPLTLKTWAYDFLNDLDEITRELVASTCEGCAIDHPSQREHDCLMMTVSDRAFFYFEDAWNELDLNRVLCSIKDMWRLS